MFWRLLALWAVSTAGAAVIEPFDELGGWAVANGVTRGGRVDLAPAPERPGRCAELSWQATRAPYLELHDGRPRELPETSTRLDTTVAVDLRCPTPRLLTGLGLRLLDARGEVFQLKLPLDLPVDQWATVRFHLTRELLKESWGDARDGVCDLPVRFLGFAVSFASRPAAGRLWLDQVRLLSTGTPVAVEQSLWRFDGREQWRVGVPPEVARLEPQASGLQVSLAASATERGVPLTETRFGPLAAAARLSLHATLVSGDALAATIRLRDARGEVFQFAARALQAGEQSVSWDLGQPLPGSWGDARDGRLDWPATLHELFLLRRPSPQPALLRLHSATLSAMRPALDSLQAELRLGHPLRLLLPGSPTPPELWLTTTAAAPQRVELEICWEGYDRWLPWSSQVVEVAPAGLAVALPAPPALGIWWLHVVVREPGGGAERELERSLAVMQPAGPTPGPASGFLFSICTHTERWPAAERALEVQAAALCGAKVVRVGPGWGACEPAKGQFNWAMMDELVSAYGAQGIEVQTLLGFTARWAAKPDKLAAADWRDWGFDAPADWDAWRNYCAALATRYRDRIRFYEVWNEPDISFWRGSLEEYLKLLQLAYEAVHAGDPTAQVLTGGFASADRNPAFIDGVVTRGAPFFNILAWHRHGTFDGFAKEVDGPLAAWRAKLQPAKPLYFNETAMWSQGGDERMQAEQLVKKLTFAWSRGAVGYTWYDLRNDGFDPHEAEHLYGMLTHDFYPKAIYPTYNTLVQLLRDKQYRRQLQLGPQRYGLVFANATEQVLVLWDQDDRGEPLTLQTSATAVQRVDLMGNRQTLPVTDGRVTVPCASTPLYLVLPDGAATVTIGAASG
ncbi:MAG: hypothetical protein IT204_11510 [Fimbriimonadaceae bacterium]|nr:hypothetical protein [Fimbriimonadaceae bacterium]